MLNKVLLIGRLTKDPELRYTTNNNTPKCLFTLATDKFSSNREEHSADFLSCVAWNKQAENLVKYCSKGSLILVEGAIHSSSYDDNDGKRVYRQDITANRITFLNTNRQGQNGQNAQNSQNRPNNQANSNNQGWQSGQNMNTVSLDTDFDNAYNIMEDDIQF